MQKKDPRCSYSKSPQFVSSILFGNPGRYLMTCRQDVELEAQVSAATAQEVRS